MNNALLKMLDLKQWSSSIKAAFLAICYALSLSVSMTIAKKLSPEIKTSSIVFMRTLFGLLFFLPFLIKNRHQFLKSQKIPLHLLRILINVCAILFTYYTYRHLPLGFATSLGMTGPLFTTLITVIFLKENIDKVKWFTLVIGYSGALLIIKPHQFVFDIAIVTSLLANILAGSSIALIKVISRHDSTITIMGYTNIGLVLAACLLNIYGWQLINLKDLGLLAIIGFLGLFSQYCSITALKLSTPSFVAPFEYTRLIFAFLIGFFIFHELPEYSTIMGAAIVAGATYFIVYREGKLNSKF